MTHPYTYPSTMVSPNPAGAPGFGGPPPLSPLPPQLRAEKKPRRGLFVAAAIGAVFAVFAAATLGVVVGSQLTTNATQARLTTTSTAPAPTAAQVRLATVDLCTRFAAANRAMPSPQSTGFDVIPSLNYIGDALRDNPAADKAIRDAVAESLRLARDQASRLSNEPARGAIQPSTTWTPDAANAADQLVWDLCRAYGS